MSLYIIIQIKKSYNIPINKDKDLSSLTKPPLKRENRLYQADWRLRYYNFKNNKFENINATTVLDSVQTVINEFKIACSVASILLATSRIIINENENKRIEY